MDTDTTVHYTLSPQPPCNTDNGLFWEQVTAVMRMLAPLTCVLVLTDRWLIGVS